MIIAAHYSAGSLGSTCFSIFWVTSRSRTLRTDKVAAIQCRRQRPDRNPNVKWTCNIFMSRLRTNGWVTGPVISSAMDVSVLAHPDPRAISHHKRTRPTVDPFFFSLFRCDVCRRENGSRTFCSSKMRPKHSWPVNTNQTMDQRDPETARNAPLVRVCSQIVG